MASLRPMAATPGAIGKRSSPEYSTAASVMPKSWQMYCVVEELQGEMRV